MPASPQDWSPIESENQNQAHNQQPDSRPAAHPAESEAHSANASDSRPSGSGAEAQDVATADDQYSDASATPSEITPSELEGGIAGNMADLTGQNIAHYFLESRLGGGAMASVYRATDQILERTIALKVLMPGADPLTRARFRQEARTVSTLEHPNIVRTLQVGQTSADGIAYIAMELVDGQSLSALLERVGTLNVVDACNLLEPIARALAYAHGLGIVHRDVKPSNILLRWASTGTPNSIQLAELDVAVVPLLSDFGIARALDSPELTSAGRTIGTPSYMAPEQCAGSRELDGRADIYSLGTVLYRTLVGRPPFVGTTTQILHAHVYEPLTIPDQVLRELPAVVIETLQWSLIKDVEHRYGNASLMADDLATAAGRKVAGPMRRPHVASGVPTRTMEILSADAPHDAVNAASSVLVPGVTATPESVRTATPPSGSPAVPRIGSTTHSKVARSATPSSVPASAPARRRRESNWLSLVIGSVLMVALVLVGIAVVRSILPAAPTTPTGIATQRAVPVAVNTAPPPTVLAADNDATPEAAAAHPSAAPSPNDPESTSDTADASGAPTAQSTQASTAAPVARATGVPASNDFGPIEDPLDPELEVSLESAWDDAQFFFEQRDWSDALTYLTLTRRRDPEFEEERLNEMLFTAYVGEAGHQVVETLSASGDLDAQLNDAADLYAKALEIEDVPDVATLLDATLAYIDEPSGERARARRTLRTAYETYARTLAAEDDFCGAAEQLTVALRVLYDAALADQQAEYLAACPVLAEAVVAEETGERLVGRLLYSSERSDGTDAIWLMPVAEDAQSSLLIQDGALPSLHPNGNLIAFRGVGSFGAEGIIGFDMSAGLAPTDRTIQYTFHGEDSEESPPSWSPNGDQLIYASTVDGDRVFRIYYTIANDDGTYYWSADGREPAWHPSANLVVYKGADNTGNRPGLWLMTNLGDNQQPLTANPTDGRPAWSPDGRYVAFMSNDRHGNWEVYRVEVETGEVNRLTSDPAFDGLPTVSPNGDFVVFISNRGGDWAFWTMPIAGGPPQRLAAVAGDISEWVGHSVQWVN